MRVELTNMIMVRDGNRVLVQDRVKSWKGFSFPGGHVEDGESFADSAARELKEETGLTARSLTGCGVIHWSNTETFDRYLAFLYKTSDFWGELLPETAEGRNIWVEIDCLRDAPSDNGMHEILRMFLNDCYSEAFGSWSGDRWSIDRFL